MKSKRVLFSALITVLIFSACNQNAKRAKVYHDTMVHAVQVVMDSVMEYGDAIQRHDKNRAVSAQQQCSSLINKTIKKINGLESFEGDTDLKHSSLELMALYRNSLDKSFTPFLSSVSSNSFSEREGFVADSLYTRLVMAENNTWLRFDSAQKRFYKQYGLEGLEK